MAGSSVPGGRIARELVGEPVTVGTYSVQPVAQLSGRYGGGGNEQGRGFGGMFRVTPTKAIVRSEDGRQEEVVIKDVTDEAISGIVRATAAVAVVCLLLTFVIRIARRNRRV